MTDIMISAIVPSSGTIAVCRLDNVKLRWTSTVVGVDVGDEILPWKVVEITFYAKDGSTFLQRFPYEIEKKPLTLLEHLRTWWRERSNSEEEE